MTYLCLDIGSRRTGVAISDPTGLLARPLGVIPGGQEPAAVATHLRPMIQEHGVDVLVLGLPRHMSGELGPEADRVQLLAAELEKLLGLPIQLWDERLSTVEATRRLIARGVRRERRKQLVDQEAAALILQGFLDAAPREPMR